MSSSAAVSLSNTSSQVTGSDDNILVARMDNAKNLANILKAVHFKDLALICASNQGIKVTVEDKKAVQANAFIHTGLFSEYCVIEEGCSFIVSLNVLIECVNIFGGNTLPGTTSNVALRMFYTGHGGPLTLLLEDGGVITDCSIKTMDSADCLDFQFDATSVVNKVIMKSDCLKDAFNELDMTSDHLEILLSPDKPHMRLSTFGISGSAHSDFPKDSDMIETFECTKTQINRYKVNLIKPTVKALVLSSKVSLRTDERGFLSLQYLLKNDEGQICFVEYYCTPDEVSTDNEYEPHNHNDTTTNGHEEGD